MGVVPKVTRDKENVPAYQVKLEKVLGLTVASNAGLDCDPNSERVAYPAGCTVVLLDTLRGKQCHILNASKKTITCVGFSSDGRYIATGECGHCPSLRLWDLQDHTMVADLAGHKYSINCLAFSPTQKYVVSVGSQHDMIVNVWDWRSGIKVASNKVSTKVKAISFAENGTYFVTVGNRHVKFWYLDYHRGSKYKDPVPLMGRSAILGEQRNNDFVDVACGRGLTADSTYTITRSGLLCEFNNRRLLDKWVELRTTSANCMTLGEHRIFIGCADGIVRCFDPHTLQFITTLPRTHYLGVDVAQGLNITHMASHPNKAKYPDAIAVAYDEKNSKLTCVYNDRSLYVWDVRDIKRVGKSHSYLYHSACIWGVEIFPEGSHANVPPGSFVTCSSDDTIRVWNVDSDYKTQPEAPYQRNIYSNELIKVIYVDPELTCLKDIELVTGEKNENPSAYDGKNGVRALRISPDGKHMASGDRAGNIRVHDIQTLEELCLIEAHDAEVLCLEYNRQLNGKKLLASASRDRLVHVFDVDEDYNFLQTLDDHSSSITAVRFLYNQESLQMVSCGADKSIIFRQLQAGPDGQVQFSRVFNAAGKATLYDMEVDVSQKHVLTACQDRNIRVYNVSSGKHTKTFKGSVGEEGSLIKVALDASGIYVATSCTDKTLCIYDYYSGECMATMSGHSELVTGLRFSQDCSRLISASGDGCVLIWTVPHDMVVTMRARLSQQAARNKTPVKLTNGHAGPDEFAPPSVEVFDPNANQPNYRFSIGQLPVWAKKQLDSGDMAPGERRVSGPKGKWAHRIDHTGITIKSFYDSDSIIPFPAAGEKRLDSDGSKEDSSVDSGAETGRSLMSNSRKEGVSVTKTRDTSIDFLHCPESLNEIIDAPPRPPISSRITVTRGSSEVVEFGHLNKAHHTDDSSLGSYKFEDIESTEHDGDIEDYSEGESSDTRRPLYVPSLDEPNREFPVTNIDSTELRKSMKKFKRPDLLLVASEMSSASRSMSGSQSDDDDHATTPTSDHTHSMSSDALDVIAHREKFLKNNFESLSGAEDASLPTKKGKRSLSSQHHGGQGVRNANLIQAAKSVKNDAKNKREELQRRIQETRRQLQSVGYRSNLKASQSIQDLSMRGMYSDSRKVVGPRHKVVQQGNEIDSRTFVRRPRANNNCLSHTNQHHSRPVSLNLTHLSIIPTYESESKSMDASLDVSPVKDCPTSFGEARRIVTNRYKRNSCSFYVDINEKVLDVGRETKSVDDLSEVGKLDRGGLGDDRSEGSDLSEYSSDSLEDVSGFGSKPRRCISEYEIIDRSRSAFCFNEGPKFEKTKFHSEENILNDNGNDNWDRHSSASFFLRRNNCRSTESMLTDESEYQFLFSSRDVFRSTESILSDNGDVREFPEDLDEVPQKQSVARTRSLQDTAQKTSVALPTSKSRPESPLQTNFEENWPERDQPARTKNETFFIPLGKGPVKPVIPVSLLKKHHYREEKKHDSRHSHHPVVAHKPPKPITHPPSSVKPAMKTPKPFSLPPPPPAPPSERLLTQRQSDPGLSLTTELPFTHGRVKLLSQNFERISATRLEDISCDSGSSTPGTSSSCANSPKRKWKPSLAKRIGNGQVLPSKCILTVEEDLSGGIRRACSLSDLSKPAQKPKAASSQVSGKTSNTSKNSTRHSTAKTASIMRSNSVGVLNQSDSESELSQSTGQRSLVSLRVMRPTISSQNKMATTSVTKARMEARRRGLSGAYSSIALNQAGNTEDSSSEENQAPAITKPTPPPRPKSVNLDRIGARRASLGRSGSERDLNRIGPSKIQKGNGGVVKSSTVASLDPNAMDLPVKDSNPLDMNKVPLSQGLVESMAVQLQKAADSVIELHKRLCSQPMDPAQREALLAAIGETQKKLDLVAKKDM